MIKRMLLVRTQAGILQLTLGIALVMTMLCGAIIFLAYYNKLGILNQLIADRLRSNALSGIEYGIATRDKLPYDKATAVVFLCDETDSVIVTRKAWGIYDLITASARHGDHSFYKTALITSKPGPITKSAVYLAATASPTYMVGHAQIMGDAFVSEAGFSSGVIDGLGFKGEKFVTGEIKRSAAIPVLDTVSLWTVKSITASEDGLPWRNDVIHHERHPFSNPAALYWSADSIYIGDALSGNIIIQSRLKIVVQETASINDVILVAPDIEIGPGFSGNVQCFATRSITIHKKSALAYPSALVLMGHARDSVISIRDSAQVHGVVVLAGYDQTTGSPGYFKIHKRGFFHGVAYINGAAEIEGKVAGHITMRSFQQHEGEVVYGNYFKNGRISSGNRSDFMPASLLWDKTAGLQIAKWLE